MKTSEPFPAHVRRFLADTASRYPAIQRVLLFGSRARGDARERSDFDMAVVAPGIERSNWSLFALEVKEEIPTLCGVDLLLLDTQMDPSLRDRIKKEGIVIYERAA